MTRYVEHIWWSCELRLPSVAYRITARPIVRHRAPLFTPNSSYPVCEATSVNPRYRKRSLSTSLEFRDNATIWEQN